MGAMSRRVTKAVRDLRKQHQMSQEALSERMSQHVPMSRASLANTESGRRDYWTVDEACTLADIFSVSLEWLVYGPRCPACLDTPPSGFSCLACGAVLKAEAREEV